MIDDALIIGGGIVLLIGAWLLVPSLAIMIGGAGLLVAGVARARGNVSGHL